VHIKGVEKPYSNTTSKHPKNAEIGEKPTWYSPQIFVEHDDAVLLKNGDTVTLINWGNAKIVHVEKSASGAVSSIEAEADFENKV